jgi:CxxC motif-containing protein
MAVNKDDFNVSGNLCPAGVAYAKKELTNPTRNIATSVRVRGGEMPMLSVKTRSPIPKGLIMEAVKAIQEIEMTAPVYIGDIVLSDVAGTGVDIVATRIVNQITTPNYNT